MLINRMFDQLFFYFTSTNFGRMSTFSKYIFLILQNETSLCASTPVHKKKDKHYPQNRHNETHIKTEESNRNIKKKYI